MTAVSILTSACNLVSGPRDRQHGAKRENFDRIATLWNAYLDTKRPGPLNAVDVGLMMVLFKLTRTQSGETNEDDFIDMAGYAACAGEIATESGK